MKIGYWLLLGVVVALALIGIASLIYVYARYGNTPLKDLPAWVLPFFNN